MVGREGVALRNRCGGRGTVIRLPNAAFRTSFTGPLTSAERHLRRSTHEILLVIDYETAQIQQTTVESHRLTLLGYNTDSESMT